MRKKIKVSPLWQIILVVYLGLRSLTLIVASIAPKFFDFKYSFPYVEDILSKMGPQFAWIWGNFDGIHYLNLAKDGYSAGGTQAFFPLYPLLIKFIYLFVGNYLYAGIIISNLAFIFILYYFYKLIRLDYSHRVAKWSLIFFSFFISSFFLVSVYTESLFISLLFAGFYYLRQKKYLTAAILGIFLTASRFVGVFFILSFIYEVWIDRKDISPDFRFKLTFAKKQIIFVFHKWLYYLLIAGLPILGVLSYMWFLWHKFGDPLLFVHVQNSFQQGRTTSHLILFYQVIWRYLKMFLTVDRHNPIYYTIWLEFLSTLSFFGLLIWGMVKKIRISYFIFAWGAFILPTLTGTLGSMSRYVLVLFPGFIVLGMIKSKWLKILILLLNIFFLIINTALFVRGYWVA